MKKLVWSVVDYFFKGLFVAGFLLLFGTVGSIEQDTITLLQGFLLMIVSIVMMLISYLWTESEHKIDNGDDDIVSKRYSA